MGRAEGLIAVGVSFQLLVLSLAVAGAVVDRIWVLLLSGVGFFVVALGAWITTWEKQLSGRP